MFLPFATLLNLFICASSNIFCTDRLHDGFRPVPEEPGIVGHQEVHDTLFTPLAFKAPCYLSVLAYNAEFAPSIFENPELKEATLIAVLRHSTKQKIGKLLLRLKLINLFNSHTARFLQTSSDNRIVSAIGYKSNRLTGLHRGYAPPGLCPHRGYAPSGLRPHRGSAPSGHRPHHDHCRRKKRSGRPRVYEGQGRGPPQTDGRHAG